LQQLEKAPSAANELVKMGVENLTDEDKKKLKTGETTVNKIVKQKKTTANNTTEPTPPIVESESKSSGYQFIIANIVALNRTIESIADDIETELTEVVTPSEQKQLIDELKKSAGEIGLLINMIKGKSSPDTTELEPVPITPTEPALAIDTDSLINELAEKAAQHEPEKQLSAKEKIELKRAKMKGGTTHDT
jgi:hypothetical protein